jgi:hypothetical protein
MPRTVHPAVVISRLPNTNALALASHCMRSGCARQKQAMPAIGHLTHTAPGHCTRHHDKPANQQREAGAKAQCRQHGAGSESWAAARRRILTDRSSIHLKRPREKRYRGRHRMSGIARERTKAFTNCELTAITEPLRTPLHRAVVSSAPPARRAIAHGTAAGFAADQHNESRQ